MTWFPYSCTETIDFPSLSRHFIIAYVEIFFPSQYVVIFFPTFLFKLSFMVDHSCSRFRFLFFKIHALVSQVAKALLICLCK